MDITTEKYIRKPLYVDAVRITQKNFDKVAAWCQGEIQTDDTDGSNKRYIKVRVHNPKNPRQTRGYIGDWILYTERGYKVYTNKAFRASFDKAPDPNVPPKVIESAELVSVGPVAEEPNPETGVQPILEVSDPKPDEDDDLVEPGEKYYPPPKEPGLQEAALAGGHPVDPEEAVPAAPTPTDISEGEEIRAARLQTETVDEDGEKKIKHEPVVPAGKTVLSHAEQARMSPSEIRGALQTGDVILEQDLAAQ